MTEPILIVGAGPTGLTAALELSRFGVPVRVIDKRDAPADTSRAIGIQARTLELSHKTIRELRNTFQSGLAESHSDCSAKFGRRKCRITRRHGASSRRCAHG